MPSRSLPGAYTDICMFKGPEGTVRSSLCFFSLPSSCSFREAADVLHPLETAYYRTLKFEKRQKSYLIGRYAAKQAIAALTGEADLGNIAIEQGVFSQPVVKHASSRNVHVSITHCENIAAAIAFPEAFPIGIDIERIDTKHRSVFESQVTEKERELFNPGSWSYEEFMTTVWTVKEALSKILKTGLTAPFHIFAVSKIRTDGRNAFLEFANFGQYQALSFNSGRYICSLVYPRKSEVTFDKGGIALSRQLGEFSSEAG